MDIIKRDGSRETYDAGKIVRALERAFASVDGEDHAEAIQRMAADMTVAVAQLPGPHVEQIQDMVENALMERGHFQVARNYIRYRAEHEQQRHALKGIVERLPDNSLLPILKEAQRDYPQPEYEVRVLQHKFVAYTSEEMADGECERQLVRAALELTSQEAPHWEYISARLLCALILRDIDESRRTDGTEEAYARLQCMAKDGYLGEYILQAYNEEEVDELFAYIQSERDNLLTYSGLDMLRKRYLLHDGDGALLEKPQEMFMTIAMHLAMPEGENKVHWAKKIYDVTSRLQLTLATPTMSNARKPYHQLSSCFIDTVPDDLKGIYRSIDNFAQVSKWGGGMGLYFGKVRATGSDIRGFKGVAGGVIRWIKLVNDTAVAVDQLGVRQGAAAVYLDVWHKDMPEFLQLRTNNGDDRMKAHDIFPAVCYPDFFWEQVESNMEGDWHLFCPHEIRKMKGYSLEDSYGDEWKERYLDCVADGRLSRRILSMKDMVRMIIKSATETGTPFVFNRDAVNRMNPNGHKGMIYSSNLCTEIAQNMRPIESVETEILTEEGDAVVVEKTRPGDFVVCNLASLVLGNIDVENDAALKAVIETAVRALDNVIELNYYPVPYAKISNKNYRSIGLGINGYHHMLAKAGVIWESEEHLAYVDELFARINRHTISASAALAGEKGAYPYFEGSDWQTGKYFDKRNYAGAEWDVVRRAAKSGMRNGYLLAIAPTSSTSIIAGTTASVDPVMNRYFLEEKKGAILPRVAPELSAETYWLYKSAHTIDQSWVVRAAGVRQRHLDQSQSLNLYITTDFTMRQLLNLLLEAWHEGVKTIYYVRSKALSVEECEACTA